MAWPRHSQIAVPIIVESEIRACRFVVWPDDRLMPHAQRIAASAGCFV